MKHIIAIISALCLGAAAADAQDYGSATLAERQIMYYEGTTAQQQEESKPLRPVHASYTIEAGSARLADTYLTPLKYRGWHTGVDYTRYQAMGFDPENWTMSLHAGIGIDRCENPAGNASMWSLMLNADWGMMRKFRPAQSLTLAAGGSTGLTAGCLYNDRNGNNPASAKGAWTINLTGYAAYQLRIGKLPVTLMYRPTLPVTGVFFAPDYGELYYEIYLGNDKGLVHGAWWGNYFSLDNLLTADLHLGSTNLRLGYRANIFSSKMNDTVTHIYNHSFVIGISGEWLSFNPRKPNSRKARSISPIF
ncbi:DUF3316 domain-containing protein [Duncaniella freteri]|uniref:DUF3316 domain-containing protein n=1 Tax=Duncaniella freteri TaxID=2530391 RepID=UPI0025582AF6|nr:DUF3316 domain-containing protein [Duncaniella freteri]